MASLTKLPSVLPVIIVVQDVLPAFVRFVCKKKYVNRSDSKKGFQTCLRGVEPARLQLPLGLLGPTQVKQGHVQLRVEAAAGVDNLVLEAVALADLFSMKLSEYFNLL